MATERLLIEVASGDVPRLNLGNFNWQPVSKVSALSARAPAAQDKTDGTQAPLKQAPLKEVPIAPIPLALREAVAAPSLNDKAFPLNLLEDKTFAGTGYNMIWRPRGKLPAPAELADDHAVPGRQDDVIQVNFTAETTSFQHSIGSTIPNRGSRRIGQSDISLNGIPYVQRVGAFENDKTFLADATVPAGIHFEPGVFMLVPKSERPNQPATINRMASIPHGTTINAQGLVPPSNAVDGKPNIPEANILPFNLDGSKFDKPEDTFGTQLSLPTFPGSSDEKLPDPFAKFAEKNTISVGVFRNPNQVLVDALKGQDIKNHHTFTLKTKPGPGDTWFGGGTSNIGFLEGNPQDKAAGKGNAQAVEMTVTYWIELVNKTLTLQPRIPNDQTFQMISNAGVLGPKFVFPPTTSLTKEVTTKVSWRQLQYSQNVTLTFNGLNWPHISVATLGETGTIRLPLPTT